jgi:hypothetical protein
VAAVEAAEPGFGGSLLSVAALFFHVFLAALLPAAAAAVLIGWVSDRARRPGIAATVVGLAAAGGVFVLWIAGTTASRARSRSVRCCGGSRWRWPRSSWRPR